MDATYYAQYMYKCTRKQPIQTKKCLVLILGNRSCRHSFTKRSLPKMTLKCQIRCERLAGLRSGSPYLVFLMKQRHHQHVVAHSLLYHLMLAQISYLHCFLAWHMSFVDGVDLQQQRTACKYCKIGRYDCGSPLIAELDSRPAYGLIATLMSISIASQVAAIAAWICLYFWHHLFLEQLPFGVTLTSGGAGRNRSGNTCIHDVLNAAQAAQQVVCSHFTIWSKYWDTLYHQLTKMHFLHTSLWRGFSSGPPSAKATNIGFTTAVQADDQCLRRVWTMCYHWPLHCWLLCTLAPNKILLGLHVVMVLLLYKSHGLTVSACVSNEIVIRKSL